MHERTGCHYSESPENIEELANILLKFILGGILVSKKL